MHRSLRRPGSIRVQGAPRQIEMLLDGGLTTYFEEEVEHSSGVAATARASRRSFERASTEASTQRLEWAGPVRKSREEYFCRQPGF